MSAETPASNSSIAGLLKDLRDETTTLLRQEVALAKVEIRENVSQAAAQAVKTAVGSFVAYAGVIVVLLGVGQLFAFVFVRLGLEPSVAAWLAPVLIGMLVALAGWLMVARAKRAIARSDLVPRKTIDSLRANKEWAERKLQHS
jgi:hypothetical protein